MTPGSLRRELRGLYPAEKPLKRRDARMVRKRLPTREEAVLTTRRDPVFAVRVPQSLLEVIAMLGELTGRNASEIKKLVVLEGVIQVLETSETGSNV